MKTEKITSVFLPTFVLDTALIISAELLVWKILALLRMLMPLSSWH